MKANVGKFYFLTSPNEESNIYIANNIINSKCGKLLGVKIEQKLNFNANTNSICKKAW